MNFFRQIVVCSAAVLCSVAHRASAQQDQAAKFPRWAFTAAVDVGSLPYDLTRHCSDPSGDIASAGAGFGILLHARSWLVVQSDTRMSAIPDLACKVTIPAPPNGQFSGGWREFGEDAPAPPLLRTAMRFGLETPKGAPLVRATVGGGLIWSGSRAPFAAATIGIGSRGEYTRFYAELESGVTRLHANDINVLYHSDSTSRVTIDNRTTSPVTLHPRWTMLHVGVEVPLRSR